MATKIWQCDFCDKKYTEEIGATECETLHVSLITKQFGNHVAENTVKIWRAGNSKGTANERMIRIAEVIECDPKKYL